MFSSLTLVTLLASALVAQTVVALPQFGPGNSGNSGSITISESNRGGSHNRGSHNGGSHNRFGSGITISNARRNVALPQFGPGDSGNSGTITISETNRGGSHNGGSHNGGAHNRFGSGITISNGRRNL
ncbi:hypothetical protein CVT25_000881 [Psilocybe cyanescens]|uniref:Uncharacterized protein n=1 Tax=Psilocybe cyanescens TaxID=93625 RepID=A0A409XES4_PSICY|nr:hypothetical protein CVT25_000881 [Psilocybe cyanescens]